MIHSNVCVIVLHTTQIIHTSSKATKITITPFFSPPTRARLRPPTLSIVKIKLMAASNSPEIKSKNDPEIGVNYPVPLSPPLPSISKEIELSRAMTASSKSSLFTLTRSEILFEDEWFIAINKPQGVYCETLLSTVPILLNEFAHSDTPSKPPEYHLANRLDRDTSGVTIVTKSHKIAAKFVKAFTDHKVKKTYIAFSVGQAPKWQNITIKSGHGRSKFGAWRVYASSDVGKTLPGGSSVRDMETLFEILSVNGQKCNKELLQLENNDKKVGIVEEKSIVDCSEKKDEILLRAYPRSGRTHQIRLHCQYLGIPLRGDVKYEGVHEWKGIVYEGHELHAESVRFDHPVSGVPVLINAPLPLWASQVLQPLPE